MSRTRFFIELNMRYLIVYLALLAAVTVDVCACAAGPPVDPQRMVSDLAVEIQNNRVRSVEVLIIPSDILTNHAVSPEELQRQYSYKITVPRLGGSRQGEALAAALKATSVTKARKSGDLRWGILFAFENGHIQTVFLDKFGRLGEIDGVPVSFTGGLYGWLQGFAVCLK